MLEIKMLFMGRKSSAAELLKWSVNQGINVIGVVTDSHHANSPTAVVARSLNIPLYSMEEAEKRIDQDSDWVNFVVSYLFWRKLRHPIIDIPKYGCINFHPAILPEYRGMGGYNIAILNKLNEWGATAHYVNKEIDTGNIINVYRFSFDYRLETAYSLEKKTLKIQEDLYKSVILDVLKYGCVASQSQNNVDGMYISKKDMLDMMKIDFETDDIDNKIQAFWFPPYNGAYIEHQGKKYTLVNDYILESLSDQNQTFQK